MIITKRYTETDYRLKSSKVIWVLNHLINRYGKPQKTGRITGPKFMAKIAAHWSKVQQIQFFHIQPSKPSQNAFIERFKAYRENVSDVCLRISRRLDK